MPDYYSGYYSGYYSLFTVHPNDLNFHLGVIMQKLDNTGTIEISPLCDNGGKISPLLGPLMKTLQDLGLNIEITQLDTGSPQNTVSASLKVWVQQEECVPA